MSFISRLKLLNQGKLRLHIFVSILITLLLFTTGAIIENPVVLTISILSFFIYWITLRCILWVQDGYKEN